MTLIKRLSVSCLFSFTAFVSVFQTVQAKDPYPIPEFTQTSAQEWLNSKPLTKQDLLGKVTLVDFWTYGCWNCYRSFPWLHSVEEALKPEGFQIIGIHSPEFENEKVHANIKEKIKKFKITNPVMVDNDMAFWKRMNNRYWPSYYLIDKKGNVRANYIGETHEGDAQAIKIENMIKQLLAET